MTRKSKQPAGSSVMVRLHDMVEKKKGKWPQIKNIKHMVSLPF